MDESETSGFLLVFFEDDDGGVGAIAGERGYFADGVFVAVAVGRAGNVDAVGKEGGEEAGFLVEV